MISLQPTEKFIIVRQLGDPTDATTYYVQAVVRNSIDDTILATINLVDKTNRRFKQTYEVPADISGLGFYIDITTSVYSDAGYTTKSGNYNDENDTYLVFDRITRLGGSGGGSDVDYKKIQAMIDGLVKKFPTFEFEQLDLGPVFTMLESIKTQVAKIEMPEFEKIELTPVIEALKNSESIIIKAIDTKEVTEVSDMTPVIAAVNEKEPDFSVVLKEIENIKTTINEYVDSCKKESESKTKVATILENAIETLSQSDLAKDKAVVPVINRALKLL